jgi:hypothetical protein
MSTFFVFLAIHKTFFQELRILGFQFSFEVAIHFLHHYFLTLGVIGELTSGHFHVHFTFFVNTFSHFLVEFFLLQLAIQFLSIKNGV